MEYNKVKTLKTEFMGYGYPIILGQEANNLPFVAFADYDHQEIWVSPLFLEFFDQEEQNAIIAHEIGHLIKGHCSEFRNFEDEVEADFFSAQLVGSDTTIQALNKSIINMQLAYDFGYVSKRLLKDRLIEFKMRIQKLSALSSVAG